MSSMRKTQDIFAQRENIFALVIFIIGAYLMLYNLSYTPLWHDEGVLAITASNIVKTGGYNGWDGRNLFAGANGLSLNSNLKIVAYPPWPALPSALGIWLFGVNELGVRFFHAVLGVGAAVIFWFLLRLDFASRPRLRVLALTLFVLSAQTILFMRLGRYVADSIFFALLTFYTYRLYMKNGQWWYLAITALAVTLGFLNHFAIGGAFALALGSWHLLYYLRQTTSRQWIEIAVAAAVTGALCLLYLIGAGIILSDERLDFTHEEYQWSWAKRHAYIVFVNFREMLTNSWLPLWIAVWFVYFTITRLSKSFSKPKKNKRKAAQSNTDSSEEDTRIIRWAVLLALFLFFEGMLELRRISTHQYADSRYLAPALAFTSLISAACIDWLWRHKSAGVYYALPLLPLILCTNLLSFPYAHANFFNQEKWRVLLPNVIKEIHQPYPIYMTEALDYLSEHAEQDDTIFVTPWQDFVTLQFYLSDKLIFCCSLDDNSPLPKDKLREFDVPLYANDIQPTWRVSVGNAPGINEQEYELVHIGKYYGYPTNRPELELHTFSALPAEGHLRIYRRRS